MPYSDIGTEATVYNFAAKMGLDDLTPEIDTRLRRIRSYSTYRPALQLGGFFTDFELGSMRRVQVIGRLEQKYIDSLDKAVVYERFERLSSYDIPCIVFTRGYSPEAAILEGARKHGVPVFMTEMGTSELISESMRWLRVLLAPTVTLHGVLTDVYGEGVLIQGDSGLGKSEAALELIKRGHRLVADDAVEIRKVSEDTLVGRAPTVTRDFIELRGIGVINIREMFGFEAIKETQNIDMIVMLSEFDPDRDYDRIGLDRKYTDILGNDIITYDIPIRPGRNIAVIVESAAINNRAIKMGYDAPKELVERMNESLYKKNMQND